MLLVPADRTRYTVYQLFSDLTVYPENISVQIVSCCFLGIFICFDGSFNRLVCFRPLYLCFIDVLRSSFSVSLRFSERGLKVAIFIVKQLFRLVLSYFFLQFFYRR